MTSVAGSRKARKTGAASGFVDNHLWAIVSVLTGLALWEFAARVVVGSKLFLAAPTQVIAAFGTLWQSGQLWIHFSTSALEFIIGYGVACLLGVALGFLMATFKPCKQALQPWVSGLYATPTVALAPLFILWFGIGIASKVIVVMLLVLFPVIINTEDGPAPDANRACRDSAILRRQCAAGLLQGLLARRPALHLCRLSSRDRARSHRRGRRGIVRRAHGRWPADPAIGGDLQHAGAVRRRHTARARGHLDDERLRLAGAQAHSLGDELT